MGNNGLQRVHCFAVDSCPISPSSNHSTPFYNVSCNVATVLDVRLEVYRVSLGSSTLVNDCDPVHQSFVTTAPPPPPPYGEGWGIAGLKCRAITFQGSLQCRGNDRVLTLGSLPQEDFLLRRAEQRAKF